jgi:hypothetical protein
MPTWPGLLLAPVLALADQVIAYAAVPWSCARDFPLIVHAIHVLFLVAVVATFVPAWSLWSSTRSPGNDVSRRRHFLAGLALASAALSALVVAAIWVPTWFIAPCVQ